MIRKKDGFQGEQAVVLPPAIVELEEQDDFCQGLFITDIGYYPKAEHHHRIREKGIGQYVLICCVDGSGFYVVDLAKAHVATINRMTQGKMKTDYEIFNVGTGRPVSVLELVTKFEQVNNLKLNYKIVGRRPGDVPAVWADVQLANEELGWKAERTLEETLAAAWKWEKRVREIK